MSTQAPSILIADDDDGDRKILLRTLKQTGLNCIISEACDLPEAIAACSDKHFDCLILDYEMPGENGIEGIRLLHEKYPYMAIIMSTGQGDELVAAEAFKNGATDYIVKSAISTDSIHRAVLNSLEKTSLKHQVDMQRHALENFANILVHDLKAPIRHVTRFSSLMGEAITTGNYGELIEFHRHVEAAGERMIELIETLHEYNKVSGQQVTFEMLHMEEVLQNVIENLGDNTDKAVISHDPLPEVYGNAPQLRQLLQNLISNGIKYCRNDSPTIHISAEGTASGWISVKDNGIGIDKKFYSEIFDPFKRLHGPNEFSGSGLGLATCKMIVDRHGGGIWCESEVGKGSTFYFKLAAKA